MHYSISAKLLFSSNYSRVTKERAVLNYAIFKCLSVDIGRVIQSSILHITKGSTIASLGHLSLIYELCRPADVPTRLRVVVVHPEDTLTWNIISHYHILSREELEHL